jgi:hypothetical protein
MWTETVAVNRKDVEHSDRFLFEALFQNIFEALNSR